MRTGKSLVTTLLIASVVTASPALADSGVKQVHCEKGQTLTKALEKARPGDLFLVFGTCRERVVITTDQITLDGQGQAVLDGGGGPLIELSG